VQPPEEPPLDPERAGPYEENRTELFNPGRDTRPIDCLAARNSPSDLSKPPKRGDKMQPQALPFACYRRRKLVADAATVALVVELGA